MSAANYRARMADARDHRAARGRSCRSCRRPYAARLADNVGAWPLHDGQSATERQQLRAAAARRCRGCERPEVLAVAWPEGGAAAWDAAVLEAVAAAQRWPS